MLNNVTTNQRLVSKINNFNKKTNIPTEKCTWDINISHINTRNSNSLEIKEIQNETRMRYFISLKIKLRSL